MSILLQKVTLRSAVYHNQLVIVQSRTVQYDAREGECKVLKIKARCRP